MYLPGLPQGGKRRRQIFCHFFPLLLPIAGRTYRDIVNNIVTLREDFPKNSNIEKVSMLGCSLGSDFSKNTLIGLKENDIETKVSSRLYDVTIEQV
jgi:hypothetical protein